jgi:hypothetical protein
VRDGDPPDAAGTALLDPGASSRLTIGDHVVVVERHPGGGVLKLLSADGNLPLEIAITKEGAVLRLGRGLTVSVAGPLALDVDSLAVNARSGIALDSGGQMRLHAGGDIVTSGDAQAIVARKGNVDVTANDDVTLHGERIKMNC